eukprot:55572-Eustigmatos_ZCMA.PRE.1
MLCDLTSCVVCTSTGHTTISQSGALGPCTAVVSAGLNPKLRISVSLCACGWSSLCYCTLSLYGSEQAFKLELTAAAQTRLLPTPAGLCCSRLHAVKHLGMTSMYESDACGVVTKLRTPSAVDDVEERMVVIDESEGWHIRDGHTTQVKVGETATEGSEAERRK